MLFYSTQHMLLTLLSDVPNCKLLAKKIKNLSRHFKTM